MTNIYQGNYKLLMIPPLLLIILSLYYIPQIKLGVDFKGGTLITLTLDENIDTTALKTNLESENIKADIKVFETTFGYKAEIEIEQSDILLKADELKTSFNSKIGLVERLEVNTTNNTAALPEYLEKRREINVVTNELFTLTKNDKKAEEISNLNELRKEMNNAYNKVYSDYRDQIAKPIEKTVKYSSISVQSVSPALSIRFIDKAKNVVILSAILSTIFVFLFFRKLIPAAAVIIGSASDVTIALGAMGLFGIPFTLPSFAALLMLVGFSLDTDVLLTKRMLDRPGNNREKAWGALKTGATMSIAAIIAFAVLFLIANATRITTYFDISAVALAGLVGDLFATWGINAVLILWYMERKEHESKVMV
ncbi:hypothetical protein J4450_01535 [Candidatus Micrarchaeota archaeon]|nr:hypothetical protein [Candidatus Micrarchaeota archaeon]